MKFTRPLICLTLIATAHSLFAQAQEPIGYPPPYPAFGSVERLDPALDALLAPDAAMEVVATGFEWAEGPVWDFEAARLYFSDIPRNTAFAWSDADSLSVYLAPSGFTGEEYDGREPGSNGLVIGPDGQLTLCQHGDRRVAQLNPNKWGYSTLADSYNGKRLNSPNDACFDSRGNLYFTDPPYGMGKSDTKELDFQGVYRLSPEGELALLTKELERPNGIALSPDEKTLYIASSHGPRPVIMAYPLKLDGSLGTGDVFFHADSLPGDRLPGANDGLKTDKRGNVWATTAGGVAILDPSGKLLGRLLTGRRTANCAFGGPDGTVLYITADDTLCRIQTKATGYFPFR